MRVSEKTRKTFLEEALPFFIGMAKRIVPLQEEEMKKYLCKTLKLESTWAAQSRIYQYKDSCLLENAEGSKSYFSCYKLTDFLYFKLVEQYAGTAEWQQADDFWHETDLLSAPARCLSQQIVYYLQGKPFLQEGQIDAYQKKMMHTLLFDNTDVLNLLDQMMRMPKWYAFMQSIIPWFPDRFYQIHVCDKHVMLEKPNEEIEQRYFTPGPTFPYNQDTQGTYCQMAEMEILKGNFAKAKELNRPECYEGKFNEAVMLVYEKKDYIGAILKFQEGLEERGLDSFESIDSLYLFIYIICLKNRIGKDDKTDKVLIKEIKNLQKEYKRKGLPWVELIALKVQGKTIEKNKALPKLLETCDTYIDALFSSIILKQYYGEEEFFDYYIEEAERRITSSPYKLLQLEWFKTISSYRTKYLQLSQEIGITTILHDGAPKIPKWERVLDDLIAATVTSGKTAGSKTGAGKQARIVYYMWASQDCTQFSFTPRLQKSNDGISWTGGRNIALKNFGASTEGATDVDIEISKHVKSYTYGWYGQTNLELNGKEVLLLLAGHPNVYLEKDVSETPVQIVKEGLQIEVKSTPNGYSFSANVIMEDNAPAWNIVRQNQYCFKIVHLTTQQRNLISLLSSHTTFPKEAAPKLTQLLGNISQNATVMSDLLGNASNSVAQKTEADSLLTVRLRPSGDGLNADIQARPLGTKGPVFQPGRGAKAVAANVEGKLLQTERDLKLEKQHLEAISPLLYEFSDEADGDMLFACTSPKSCLQLLDALYNESSHCRLEWPEGEKFRIARKLEAKDLILSVKGARSWFEVDGEIKVSEHKILGMAEILERLRASQGRFIQIGDNEYIALSEQLRKQLSLFESMANVQRKKVQLSQFSTASLEALEEAGVTIEGDKTYTKFIQKLHDSAEAKFSFPKGLQAELRDYQREGVLWMSRLASWGAGACLADDMGLGKTLQAITLMLARKSEGPSLVVVPTSVSTNWRNEIERFAPQLNPLLLNTPGTDREKMISEAGRNDVIITTYGLLVTEEERLISREWNMIVLDEAHTIKNKETKMSHAAMQLQGAFRLLLTGTPLQNHLGELWNLFQFSNPGLLGSNAQFQEKFILPIEKQDNKERMRQLKKIVTPFILRRTKNEVLDELPEKSEITVSVQLSDEEMAVYENLRRQAITILENGESTPMQTLAEITKLRQAACNVRLIDDKLKLESSKLSTLLSLISNLMVNGHRALIFSQFTSHLALVREALDAAHIDYLYLDGACTAREREKLVKEFQNGAMPLFLISLKAGGTGLNLTAADYVFHLDPWWNPAIEDQASDRAYRIGQTRPVTIYRLIAQQTIEEKIVKLHSTKKSLADSLLAGTNASHKLTKEEILQLL